VKDVARRLAYLGLQVEDCDYLARLHPILEEHAEELVAAFYRNLLSFEPTRELLRDPQVKDRLLVKQREYLLSLAGPSLDEAFVAQRRQIGEVHERIGLEPRWYLGAYAVYLSLLIPVIHDAYADDPECAMRSIVALQKLLFFDVQLAMEAYIEHHESELAYQTRELEAVGLSLAHDFEKQRAELRDTMSRARAAEELASIGTLVAGLAHEVGTPMGVIQGHAKLLEREVLSENGRWRLRTIQEQIGRIARIIQTLLNMARPERQKPAPVALDPLLATTLSFLSERLEQRGIAVICNFESVPSIDGSTERLQQLFLNLFLNASDAMPDGGELHVALRALATGEVEVRVRDTGRGIDAAILPHIFEPFFTTKDAGHGNGLGLMVAKGIVSDHGGTIEVSSTPGQGAEFRIVFPAPARDGAPA
jgi:signal transduction histidine kinase